MATIKEQFASSVGITISLANLGASATAGQQSTAVDNTTNLYNDALVSVILSLGSGTIGGSKAAYIYAYGSEDGTNYTDVATGSDGTITPTNPPNLKLIGVVSMPVVSVVYKGVFSVAQAFGGVLPRKWGIVVINDSNVALAASGSSVSYTGVTYQSA